MALNKRNQSGLEKSLVARELEISLQKFYVILDVKIELQYFNENLRILDDDC